MCRATQKAACRVPVTCRCVTGVRPHTRHAPRGPESGAREQRAAVPPPPGPPSRPPPVQRSAERLSFAPQRRSERTASARGGAGEERRKREREGRAGAAHTHSVRNSYGGDKAHGLTGAFRGAGYPWPCGVSAGARPVALLAPPAGRPPRFKVFSYPRCQNPRGTRTRPPPHTGTAQTASIILHMLIFSPPVTTRGRAQPGCPSL